MSSQEISYQPRYKSTAKGVNISQLHHTFCLSGHALHFFHPGIQRMDCLIYIFFKDLPILCQNHTTSLLFK